MEERELSTVLYTIQTVAVCFTMSLNNQVLECPQLEYEAPVLNCHYGVSAQFPTMRLDSPYMDKNVNNIQSFLAKAGRRHLERSDWQ